MRIIDAKKPFSFEITHESVRDAIRNDATHCVVALGVQQTCKSRGLDILHMEVGPQRTTMIFTGRAVRYRTPEDLRKGLLEFDETGDWSLPLGAYVLKPLPKSLTFRGAKDRYQQRLANGDPHAIGPKVPKLPKVNVVRPSIPRRVVIHNAKTTLKGKDITY